MIHVSLNRVNSIFDQKGAIDWSFFFLVTANNNERWRDMIDVKRTFDQIFCTENRSFSLHGIELFMENYYYCDLS
jgi:hypothetical protein